MKLRKPSPGLVVALVALIVAMSGSAIAASFITSSQIKDGTIQLKDISAKARKGLRGVRGPAGPVGAINPIVRQGAVVSVPVGQTAFATSECRPGERVTGGGSSISGASGWQVVESFPTPGTSGSTPTGWLVRATNTASGGPNNLVAIAICVGG
jgi:hypothetical protein